MNNENIILDNKNIMICKINNQYSFEIKKFISKSPKLLIKDFSDIIDVLDNNFLKLQEIEYNIDKIAESFAYTIYRDEKIIIDKNQNEKKYKEYKIEIKSIFFDNLNELINYLQKLFEELQIVMLKYSDNDFEYSIKDDNPENIFE